MRVKVAFLCLVLCFSSFLIYSEESKLLLPDMSAIKDHSDIRTTYFTKFFGASVQGILNYGTQVLKSAQGDVVVSVEKKTDFVFIRLAQPIEEGKINPVSPGDYLVRRDAKKGYLQEVKIYYAFDEESYLLLKPTASNQTSMDIFLNGEMIHAKIAIATPVYMLLMRPFDSIVRSTRNSVDWNDLLARSTIN